jgi:LmbE family N-acetylglucosaminyl deacetylase
VTNEWNGRRLLVVVAHPDDETFGCGSVIARAAQEGASVTVCCATRGEAGELAPGYDLGDETLAERRVRELHDAATMLGVAEVVLLDFGDSGMTGEAPPHTLCGAALEQVVDAVARVITRVDPDVIVTLDEMGGDGHRDHVRIGEATTVAARRAAPGASVYQWTVVRSLLRLWFDTLRRSRPDAGHLQLDDTDLGRPDEDITTVLDATAVLELRRRAIALHASQHSPYDDLPDDLAEAFLTRDRLVRVAPPWSGGPIETALRLGERHQSDV